MLLGLEGSGLHLNLKLIESGTCALAGGRCGGGGRVPCQAPELREMGTGVGHCMWSEDVQ